MYILGINETLVTDDPVFKFGQRALKEDGKEYIYVRYVETTAGAAGEFCGWTTRAISLSTSFSNDGFSVTRDYSDTHLIGAGILQGAMTNGQCGWIQTRGLAVPSVDISGLAAGDIGTIDNSAADGNIAVIALVTEVPICVVKAGGSTAGDGQVIVQGVA